MPMSERAAVRHAAVPRGLRAWLHGLRSLTRPPGRVQFSTRGMWREAVRISAAARDTPMLDRYARAIGAGPSNACKRTGVFRCHGQALLVSAVVLGIFGRG